MPTIPHVVRHSLKNILFPTDFSPASSVALALALALARTYGSTLLLAHTISPQPHRQLIADRLSAPDDRLREDARHKLSNFTRSLGATSFKGLLEPGDLEAVLPTNHSRARRRSGSSGHAWPSWRQQIDAGLRCRRNLSLRLLLQCSWWVRGSTRA